MKNHVLNGSSFSCLPRNMICEMEMQKRNMDQDKIWFLHSEYFANTEYFANSGEM
jgi:hypothetical protein